ncbi:DUF1737 domain-containing protein [Vibrio cholerae]
MNNLPPNGLPIYRLISGPDDASFCTRVSEQLEVGYKLYGSPAISISGEKRIVCQAVVWPMDKNK